MSIANIGNGVWEDFKLNPAEAKKKYPLSVYSPKEEEREVRAMIIRDFTFGWTTMYTPRREFNDLSVISRMTVDQMSFNTYQPNNGESYEGDLVNAWRSNAIRPIVRNKCVSIAAHATARLIFPKIFANNSQSDSQEDAAKVMGYLMEWAADKSNYEYTSMTAVIAALVNPASIVYTEYGEVFKTVKREKGPDGKWIPEKMIDPDQSGFKDFIVPVDELFIENIYEHDVQKQGWLIWRKVIGYDLARAKYQNYPNWQYVQPGVQILFNDANQLFYDTYDNNMRMTEVEEIVYWNKSMDLKLCLVNGVLLSDPDNPNPRNDKQYPFSVFGYELIDEGKFFYYKSLAFKMQSDANVINTLYPMIIDGTYLSVFPAMFNIGSEVIGSDVIVPGAVTNLTDINSKIQPIQVSTSLKTGMDTLMQVESSINESSEDPIDQGQSASGDTTAYEISRMEQNAATVLGLFIKMISKYVKGYGKLRVGDIIQYLTIPDVDKITDNPGLVYKTFLVGKNKGKYGTTKISFDSNLPPAMDRETYLDQSYKLLKEQKDTGQEIYKVNPSEFRDLEFQVQISPDVLQPKSEDLERAMKLELFDRSIQLGPLVDQEKVIRDFLFGAYPEIRDSDEYLAQQNPMAPMGMANPAQPGIPSGPMATPPPINPLMKPGITKPTPSPLPQVPSSGKL